MCSWKKCQEVRVRVGQDRILSIVLRDSLARNAAGRETGRIFHVNVVAQFPKQ